MTDPIRITAGDHATATWATNDYADQAPLTAGDWSARADISETAGLTSVASWTVSAPTLATTTVTDDTLVFVLTLLPATTRALIPAIVPPTQTRTLTTDLEVTGPAAGAGDEIHTHGPVPVLISQDVTI